MSQVTIIGSGPAGYAAAIYTARAGLCPTVVASSVEAGGDLAKTTEVENYPGFIEGIMGPELMERMQKQAERFGARVLFQDALNLELSKREKTTRLSNGKTLVSPALILATGSQYRQLGLEDEARLTGKGVSWCATCDAFFFRDKVVGVVGGGDSALEEATFLTRFASRVYVIYRGGSLRASKAMQKRAMVNDKIKVIWYSEVIGLLGAEKLTGVRLIDNRNQKTSETPLDGLFIAIGSTPRTNLVEGQLRITEQKTVWVEGRSSKTSQAGVFAAGDVLDSRYRQAVTAAASGTVAALDAEKYLTELTD